MASSYKNSTLLPRLKHLLTLQKNYKPSSGDNMLVKNQGQIDKSNWRKLDSRNLGICRTMIPDYLWIVLKILRSKGHEAYLVGGCVRDLILKRIPKDFDVITTAALKQVKKQFHRSVIVGIRFPICRVHIRGSVVEVSSFDTVAKHNEKKQILPIPHGCNMKDYARWKNCMLRDFTINSLFFDPFESKIYDYANAMRDLRSLKLQTLIPAHLSFEEDCARILRGLRLAARLGLSLSQETEIAIQKLVPSIASLPQSRIMMEMNYMLSYGASEPSLSILQRFKLLEILLPVHAAYLSQKSCNYQSSVMLMKLFNNLDKLVTCDLPTDSNLWVGLLSFHMALIVNPQDALVVWTFASVLYHGNWKEGVTFGREHAQKTTPFVPEITQANHSISDDDLAVRVTQLALAVQDFTSCLSQSDNLLQLMARFPDSSCSGLVFVSFRSQRRASNIFSVLAHNIESYVKERTCSNIDYKLLGQGHISETRFVLGKIIMDTMGGSVQGSGDAERTHKLLNSDLKNEDAKEKQVFVTSDSENEIEVFEKENRKRGLPPHITEPQKDAKRKKVYLENCSDSEGGNAVNTDFDTLAKLKLHLIEKNKNGIRNMLDFVKDQKHPKIENVKQQDWSEAKLKPVRKKEKNIILVLKKTNLSLDTNKDEENVSENNGGGESKTVKPEEDVNMDKQSVKRQDKPKKKSQLGKKNVKTVVDLVKPTSALLEMNTKREKKSDNNGGCVVKAEKPEKAVNNGHPKIENVKRKDRPQAKLKRVSKETKKVTSSAEKRNSPLGKNKKCEEVSENSGGGGQGRIEKPEEDLNKHKLGQSLSSLLQLVKDSEHPKIENAKWQDRSEEDLKLDKKNVYFSSDHNNSLLTKNRNREIVSENVKGGNGKTEKPKEDMNTDKHKTPSLSSMFRVFRR